MSATRFAKVVRHIHHMASGVRVPEQTDRELLEAFSVKGDEQAFAALVGRHGPMVYRICRRLLNHEQDTEDAFQAVFLILACNGRTIRKHEALSGWLHGVAYRTAMKAKRTAARRRNHETAAPARPQTTPEVSWNDVQVVLDEEIQNLPRTYRAAFVLCVIEGRTGPDAARELGIPVGTVSSRVTGARKRLQAKLSRRGIEFSAMLAALSVATGASQALPAHLLQSKLLGDLFSTAFGAATNSVPGHIVALANSVSRSLLLSNAKVIAGVLLAGLVFAGGGTLAHEALGKQPVTFANALPVPAFIVDQPRAQPTPATPKDKQDQQAVTYSGRVLDPDGKPAAGARIYLLYYTPKNLPVPLRATSDKDGRYRFEVARSAFDKSASVQPWNEAMVVARADGYGLGMAERTAASLITSIASRTLNLMGETLRLTKDDVPVKGRLLDIDGKPCRGVAVHVKGLQVPKNGNLDAFLKNVNQTKVFYPSLRNHLDGFEGWIGRDLGKLFGTVHSDADGRFVLHGIGQERFVQLSISGSKVTTTPINALTRAGELLQIPNSWNRGAEEEPTVIHGSAFDLVLHPSQPVVGVVRDKDTGAPLAGALVKGRHRVRTKYGFGLSRNEVNTITDDQGHYQLTGLPKGPDNVVAGGPPEGQPYLTSESSVPDPVGLDPIQVDLAIKRGIWLEIRVFDKSSGEPVNSQVEYAVFEDNPNGKDLRGLTFEDNLQTQAATGMLRIVGLPGHALVGARPYDNRYPRSDGSNIKGLKQGGFFSTYPLRLSAGNFSGLVEINPANGSQTVKVEIPLELGGKLIGTVLDPEGKPLSGVRVSGLHGFQNWENVPLPTAEFMVTSLKPGQPWMLQFAHLEKKLAGCLILKGTEKGPLTVKLGAAGAIRGRLVSRDGVPVTGGELVGMRDELSPPGTPQTDNSRGSPPNDIRPDQDGRFLIECLASGLTYKLGVLRSRIYLAGLEGKASGPLRVKPGETLDLGDVVVNLQDN